MQQELFIGLLLFFYVFFSGAEKDPKAAAKDPYFSPGQKSRQKAPRACGA